ncbi:MAG: UDP-3-O-(3-hydroxymyristoyl)glucosamine N-acyltransferase [Caulobacteraceae bacterium]|nr:UDP-3-O-(3-hydroxymyristoyl)glucosamine N-acyltransferase [Caulobacteraceae bacterium]
MPAGDADQLPEGCIALATSEPHVAYAKLAAWLHPPREMEPGDPPVHPSAVLEEDVRLGPYVVIGAGARIGRGTRIGANSVIGPGVQIGRDGQIGANVNISFALVGDRVRLLAGATIGEAGFGIAGGPSGMFDVPQLGRVILQDDVTVGANSCIDRGGFEDTVIGESTKIDNLCQVGHNTRLGRGCVLVSQVGVSGSVTAGDGVRFGGQAGIADHLTIGDGATLMARTGLISNVPAREVWGGYPAMPRRQWLKQHAWLAKAAGKPKKGEGDPQA